MKKDFSEEQAIGFLRKPILGALVHSDQSSAYTSDA
ncbi:hypothetical protein XaFJ1_GM002619 [Xanthomonas albilineans]|nr:hypothetical protein XaFJ1_GM002619 [Xanthomonas albilineans]